VDNGDVRRRPTRIQPGARAELLRVLTSPSDIRADVIRQFHERHLDLAEVLIDLEADELLRGPAIEALLRTLD
jgi:hypothetical protein